MKKSFILVSQNYRLIDGFRRLFSSACKVTFCTDVSELQPLLLRTLPDGILIDELFSPHLFLFPEKFSSIGRHKLYVITEAISYHLKHAGLPFISFPRDIPLLIKGEKKLSPSLSDREKKILESFAGIYPAAQRIREQIVAASRTDMPVLITGETGTGKGVTAALIHDLSSRQNRKMEVMNMANMSDSLAEADLFGTVKGAFTDAVSRPGSFERANGSTLFLDEIGEFKKGLQAKLLHVIESKNFQRLGGSETHHTDVRLIFATNVNLKAAIARNEFRADLYYRISHFCIHIPPLRERKEDILPIARYFLRPHAKVLSQGAEDLLSTFNWLGNVRQLLNCLEYALTRCHGDVIDLPHIVLG